MRPRRRTTLAAALIGVAVLLPTGAWYVTGSREAARRSQAIEAAAAQGIREDVESKAARLGTRLEDLRLQESMRPFFHYQTLYHDPRGASQGLAVTPSPLASGSPDPLVWAHFQIDESGLVTLPTVSEPLPELTSDADIEQDLPPTLFDADAPGQILENLLDNAEKHTRMVEDRRVSVTVGADDGQLRTQVTDNDPGIPRSQRRTMFRPFDRAEDAVGRPGLGLGLAVARSFARAQGGELELDADSDSGAQFILTIPHS